MTLIGYIFGLLTISGFNYFMHFRIDSMVVGMIIYTLIFIHIKGKFV